MRRPGRCGAGGAAQRGAARRSAHVFDARPRDAEGIDGGEGEQAVQTDGEELVALEAEDVPGVAAVRMVPRVTASRRRW